MRTASVVAILALAPTFASCHRPSAATTAPLAHFAVVLEHSVQGWTAHCQVGCRWTDSTMACGGCQIRLSAAGVGPARLPEDPTEGFAFTLQDAGTGWEATGVRGVRWRALSWQCQAAVCRARIDETGVVGS